MRKEYQVAMAAFTSLALAAKLANPVSAQEVDPNAQSDAQIASQLRGARAGDQFPLDNVNLSIHGRFPWVGGETDLALIGNDILGIAYQTDCAFNDSYSKGFLRPFFVPRIPRVRVPGIHLTDHRLERLDVELVVPEEFPLLSISKVHHLKDGDTDTDCEQVGAEADLLALAQKINRKLVPAAGAGGRTIGSTVRAFVEGLLDRN